MTDVGTTPRRSMTTARKLRVFEAHRGICHLCGRRIIAGEPWDVEHVRALALGGADDDANTAPAHRRCHAEKTPEDVSRIAKAKRVKARHLGIAKAKTRPMPGSKASGIRKRMNGQVERRAALWAPGNGDGD